MENYAIKNAMFGGFDKLDVVRYVENLARDRDVEKQTLEEDRQTLESENCRLRERNTKLEEELSQLREQLRESQEQLEKTRQEQEEVEALRREIAPLREAARDAERLRAETESLRHDAEAYARFRTQLGTIECEARERANNLEIAAAERVRQTLSAFHAQYQDLVHIFENTATHVTGELRKVQVNLDQLPKVMDQADSQLKAMEDRMEAGEPIEKPESE